MEHVIDALKRGEAVLLATDTVYGLAALPNSQGYDRIFVLKNRPQDMTLPLLIADPQDIDCYACDIPDYAYELAQSGWPGALTLVLKSKQDISINRCVREDGTIALRCPDEDDIRAICRALNMPLACTSANKHGQVAPSRIEDIPNDFLELPHLEPLKESCARGVASTIIDCTKDKPLQLR